MGKIEEVKYYEGRDLETIFFRPMLSGRSAEELGIKVLYNMPVPTTLHFWRQSSNILQSFDQSGWVGGSPADRFQKQIDLYKLKAEMGFSADDYFNQVYELITGRADVNMDDLTGTELEQAETELFRQAIAESIRATMWIGNTNRGGGSMPYQTFDGFVTRLTDDVCNSEQNDVQNDALIPHFAYNKSETDWAEKLLRKLWSESTDALREFKPQGELVYLVTSDVYAAYEESLDSVQLDSAYIAKQEGREALSFRGIPVIDIQVGNYLREVNDTFDSFAILTDRRNLALAVNTNDFPGTEVRMWYNPDEMQNRQRAIFMAGCDYLLPELITFAYHFSTTVTGSLTATGGTVDYKTNNDAAVFDPESISVQAYNSSDVAIGNPVTSWSEVSGTDITRVTVSGTNIAYVKASVSYWTGDTVTTTIEAQ